MPPLSDRTYRERKKELGSFLRARREALDNKQLGLPSVGRRRTPGLRREEVAQLAGVSVTWYTWLEQGRDVKPSSAALQAISQALQCSATEHNYLCSLAGVAPHSQPETLCESISNTDQQLLAQLEPLPAIIQNTRFDILGFNRAFCALVGVDLNEEAQEHRNCIYLALTNAAWRACLMPDWQDALPSMVAMFRSGYATHNGEPAWEERLQSLKGASPEFEHAWQRHEIGSIENRHKRFFHPQQGEMLFEQRNWWSQQQGGNRLMIYQPADAAARTFIATLS